MDQKNLARAQMRAVVQGVPGGHVDRFEGSALSIVKGSWQRLNTSTVYRCDLSEQAIAARYHDPVADGNTLDALT